MLDPKTAIQAKASVKKASDPDATKATGLTDLEFLMLGELTPSSLLTASAESAVELLV